MSPPWSFGNYLYIFSGSLFDQVLSLLHLTTLSRTFTAPHIEDLVMLPTPVLRLLNVLDDDYLKNEDEYEG